MALKVEATGVEPVSKHLPQKLSTCLFSVLIVGHKPERNKPIYSLAESSFVAGTAYCNSILYFIFESAAELGNRTTYSSGPNDYLITD